MVLSILSISFSWLFRFFLETGCDVSIYNVINIQSKYQYISIFHLYRTTTLFFWKTIFLAALFAHITLLI